MLLDHYLPHWHRGSLRQKHGPPPLEPIQRLVPFPSGRLARQARERQVQPCSSASDNLKRCPESSPGEEFGQRPLAAFSKTSARLIHYGARSSGCCLDVALL